MEISKQTLLIILKKLKISSTILWTLLVIKGPSLCGNKNNLRLNWGFFVLVEASRRIGCLLKSLPLIHSKFSFKLIFSFLLLFYNCGQFSSPRCLLLNYNIIPYCWYPGLWSLVSYSFAWCWLFVCLQRMLSAPFRGTCPRVSSEAYPVRLEAGGRLTSPSPPRWWFVRPPGGL